MFPTNQIKKLRNIPISRVAGGQHHSLFLTSKGDRIYSCGITLAGQTGLQDDVKSAVGQQGGNAVYEPTPVAFPNWTSDRMSEIGRFTDISCGERLNISPCL